jgi:hypothetical protein
LVAQGLLQSGVSRDLVWRDSYGDKIFSAKLFVAANPERVMLTYQWAPLNQSAIEVESLLLIDRTSCHYGSDRPWFLCPDCSQRCAIIYFGAIGYYFGCRKCVNLAYPSQCEGVVDRLRRKQDKLLALVYRKGLHTTTREKLYAILDETAINENQLMYPRYLAALNRLTGSLSYQSD